MHKLLACPKPLYLQVSAKQWYTSDREMEEHPVFYQKHRQKQRKIKSRKMSYTHVRESLLFSVQNKMTTAKMQQSLLVHVLLIC